MVVLVGGGRDKRPTVSWAQHMKGEAQPSLFAVEPCHENLSVRDRDPIYVSEKKNIEELILTAPIFINTFPLFFRENNI